MWKEIKITMNLKFQVVVDYFGQAKKEMIYPGAGSRWWINIAKAAGYQLNESINSHHD